MAATCSQGYLSPLPLRSFTTAIYILLTLIALHQVFLLSRRLTLPKSSTLTLPPFREVNSNYASAASLP